MSLHTKGGLNKTAQGVGGEEPPQQRKEKFAKRGKATGLFKNRSKMGERAGAEALFL